MLFGEAKGKESDGWVGRMESLMQSG